MHTAVIRPLTGKVCLLGVRSSRRESQLRQVTPRRLLPTRLLQLKIAHLSRSFLPIGIWSNSDYSPNTNLEFELLQVVSGRVEARTDGDVMGVHVRCTDVRYAVMQASSNKDRPERLVIAYQDEDCLRDLVAAPSIFGLGFASHEEAIANLKSVASDTGPSKQSLVSRKCFTRLMRTLNWRVGPA